MKDVVPNDVESITSSEDVSDFNDEQMSNDEKRDEKMVLEKLDFLLKLLSNLQNCFNEKIETDSHKNILFDNMHKELIKHQNGIMDKVIDSMALDIIQLTDATKGYVRIYEQKEPNKDNYLRLLKIVKGISEDLQDILYRQSIESYKVLGHDVDVHRQKIIQSIETDDKSKDNKVAFRVAEGYEKNGKIIRPERIKIFKYKLQTDEIK